MFKRKNKGFTLIEMMIVVAIIALLATIAIPNYINFQKKAKTAEAKSNLGAIRTCEEAYHADKDTYLACGVAPATASTGVPVAWTNGGAAPAAWASIGYEPKGGVRYQYSVDGVSASAFTGNANGSAASLDSFQVDEASTSITDWTPASE